MRTRGKLHQRDAFSDHVGVITLVFLDPSGREANWIRWRIRLVVKVAVFRPGLLARLISKVVSVMELD